MKHNGLKPYGITVETERGPQSWTIRARSKEDAAHKAAFLTGQPAEIREPANNSTAQRPAPATPRS